MHGRATAAGGEQSDQRLRCSLKASQPAALLFDHLIGAGQWSAATPGASHLDHPLAAVLSRQKSDQRLRRVFEAVDDVLLDFQLAGGDPGLQVG
jgi:hypothetical protein